MPERLAVLEPEVEKLLRSRLTRGSITFILRVRSNSADTAQTINTAALNHYLDQLKNVASLDNMRIDLAAVLALPGVCEPPEIDEATRHHQWQALQTITDQAMDKLIEMRRVEGRAMRDDLLKHCKVVREHTAAITEFAGTVVEEYHQRLLQRVNDLLSQSKLELQLEDLRREIAVYAERCDINEELSRLHSHLDQFENLCDSREPAGRKLDFLTQELLREANTIASKSNDARIAQHVVDIKGAIDRLKEQVQNIE
jgi:uncharacterized protein (TIGR00255 family)